MILGIGTDIFNISRINSDTLGKIVTRILTQEEKNICESINKNKINYIAKRWAGKEAVSKAFGCGIGESLSFQDFAILNDEKGAPFVKFYKNNINSPCYSGPISNVECKISISDEENFAIAFVILEEKK